MFSESGARAAPETGGLCQPVGSYFDPSYATTQQTSSYMEVTLQPAAGEAAYLYTQAPQSLYAPLSHATAASDIIGPSTSYFDVAGTQPQAGDKQALSSPGYIEFG